MTGPTGPTASDASNLQGIPDSGFRLVGSLGKEQRDQPSLVPASSSSSGGADQPRANLGQPGPTPMKRAPHHA